MYFLWGVILFELLSGGAHLFQNGLARALEEAMISAEPGAPAKPLQRGAGARALGDDREAEGRAKGDPSGCFLRRLKNKRSGDMRRSTRSAWISNGIGGNPVLAHPESIRYRARNLSCA